MPETSVYDDLGVALIDIELHKAYRTVFGRLRCEWCKERCDKTGRCPTGRGAVAYFDANANARDRQWYTSTPHADLFSNTEVHAVLDLSRAPKTRVLERPPAPEERPRRRGRRRGRKPSPHPDNGHRHEYQVESPGRVAA